MTRGAEPRKGRQEIDNLVILWLASCYYHVEACQRKNKYNCLKELSKLLILPLVHI